MSSFKIESVKSNARPECAWVKWHIRLLATLAANPSVCMVYRSLKIHTNNMHHICMHARVGSSVRESPGASYSNVSTDKAFRQSGYQTLSLAVCLWIFSMFKSRNQHLSLTGSSMLQDTHSIWHHCVETDDSCVQGVVNIKPKMSNKFEKVSKMCSVSSR